MKDKKKSSYTQYNNDYFFLFVFNILQSSK